MKKLDYEKIIADKLKAKGKKPVKFKVLLAELRKSYHKFSFEDFTRALENMKNDGVIIESEKGIALTDKKKLIKCEVVRVTKTFAFVKDVKTATEYFVSGKSLKGAMPTDIVMCRQVKSYGDSPEAEVVTVAAENCNRFTGDIVREFGRLRVMPDSLCKSAMDFLNPDGIEVREGDKVMVEIIQRGKRHSDHLCSIVSSFGSSLKASVCALSVLDVNGVTPVFPPSVIANAREVSDYRQIDIEAKKRLDLRNEKIFTIDSADTKDIDDAVSVKRTENGYELGVHIADVSFYVKEKSPLDDEAFKRGTSVYYANRVIPMLPKELSNSICSLNPNEDRLAFSCLMKLDNNADVVSFKFSKSVIRSKVKGVYSEINELLEGFNGKALTEKYAEVIDCLPVMNEIADKLLSKRKNRGAPSLSSVESKLIIDENDICVDVKPRERGRSEEIIEDFMLLANECAARFGREKKLPFVYRIHEDPSDEKLMNLKAYLTLLNVPFPNNKMKFQPKDFADILERTKGEGYELAVNNMVLRAMAKAKYSPEPIGHFGLVLADYAHFTSPIRRYPDLAIHRIMTAYLSGVSFDECSKKYSSFVDSASDNSTNTEIRAMTIERDCEERYKAEFMKSKIGEEADGIISSVTGFGVFVTLPNTCEGLVHIETMPDGEYYYDGGMTLKNMNTGDKYSVGDKMRVKVVNANVSAGKVDFEPV